MCRQETRQPWRKHQSRKPRIDIYPQPAAHRGRRASRFRCCLVQSRKQGGHLSMEAAAFVRERQIKKWNRAWKIRMIEERNPQWLDLYERLNQ